MAIGIGSTWTDDYEPTKIRDIAKDREQVAEIVDEMISQAVSNGKGGFRIQKGIVGMAVDKIHSLFKN